MPRCVRVGWFLPFTPSPYERGVWKRHFVENIKMLIVLAPKVSSALVLEVCKLRLIIHMPLQWAAADAEIKVLSGENTELTRSPFKAWSRSVYSHTFYAYCPGFLPCLFLTFRSIHLQFFQNLSQFFFVGCGWHMVPV